MNHTQEFIDKIAEHAGIRPTTYAIAKYMEAQYGWSRPTVMRYRNGNGTPSDRHALQIAQELDLPAGYVLASVAADRARDEQSRGQWEKAAEALRKTAAAVAAVIMSGAILAGGGIESARASAGYMTDRDLDSGSPVIHYAQLWRRIRAALRGFLEALDSFADGLAFGSA